MRLADISWLHFCQLNDPMRIRGKNCKAQKSYSVLSTSVIADPPAAMNIHKQSAKYNHLQTKIVQNRVYFKDR